MSSVRVFRLILVISHLILILIPVIAIVLSYFFLLPRALDDTIERSTVSLSLAFAIWGCVLVLTSICFMGITFTNSCCLHLISALLLAASATLASWLVTEQFVFRETPDWRIVGIALPAALIWAIQVITELLLSCILCCSPTSADSDAEAAKKAEAEEEAGHGKRSGDDGTDEEKEKLVLSYPKDQTDHNSHGSGTAAAGHGGAFVPSPQAPPIEEVDEGEEDDDDEDEDEEEEEADSQAGNVRMIDRNNPNHPQDMALRSIPEERQRLILNHPTTLTSTFTSGLRPTSRTSQGSSSGAPLATPEDTGV